MRREWTIAFPQRLGGKQGLGVFERPTAAPPFPLLCLLLLAGETKAGVSSYFLTGICFAKMKWRIVSSGTSTLTSCNSKDLHSP